MPKIQNLMTTVCDSYAAVNVDLPSKGLPFWTSPPFGGMPGITWTDSNFADSVWYVRSPNPAQPQEFVRFTDLPGHHAWTARLLLWAAGYVGNADSIDESRSSYSLSSSSATQLLSHFRLLRRFLDQVGKKVLTDITQDDLRACLLKFCGEMPQGKPRSRKSVERVLTSFRSIYFLGPASGYWLPDGLSFDPWPVGSEILNNATLRESEPTALLEESEAHRLVSTAIQWVEDLGRPLLDLRDLSLEYEAWLARVKPKNRKNAAFRFLKEHPEALKKYSDLRAKFPAPLDSYVLNQRLLPEFDSGKAVVDRVEAYHKEIVDQIAVDDNPTFSYRFQFSLSALSPRIQVDLSHHYKFIPSVRDAIRKCWADIIDRVHERRRILELPALKDSHYFRTVEDPRYSSANRDAVPDGISFKRILSQYDGVASVMSGMCYVIFGVFNGWRISEIVSIEDGFLRETLSGFEQGSKVRKTGVDPNAITHRPVPIIVAKTAKLLAEMNAPLFTEAERRLFRNVLGRPSDRRHVDSNVSNACRVAGVPGGIDSHQWRRFFAYFYLRRFKGNLDAVRRHFKQVTRHMIWAYCQDAVNAAYLIDEEKALALEIAEGIILGESYRARHIAQQARAEYAALNLPIEKAEAWIRSQMEKLNLRSVYPTPWGYCLFQSGDIGAACDAKESPVLSRAEPITCGGCKFFVSGDENVEFWQGTALLHQSIIECKHHTPLLKSASRSMLQVCRSVLERHSSTSRDEQSAASNRN